MLRLRLAFRNTLRNKRRTALNILMISGGVAAIILFRGFAHRILVDLRDSTIKGHAGHVQMATRAFWEKSDKSPKTALISNYQAIASRVRLQPHVQYAAGRLSFYGLISAGEKAMSARGVSLDPVAEKEKNETFRILEGSSLDASQPFGLIIGCELAKSLGVKAGSALTVLSYTFDGVVNALDVEVRGVFRTGVSGIDETTFILPLETAQRLLDTDRVEQIVVGLDHTDNVDLVLPGLVREVAAVDPSVVVRPWTEFADFYHQAASFFRTQNRVIEFILLAIVLLGVLNTIGMSVFERSSEIGTVRALGDTEGIVLFQFLLEGAILGGIGALTGALLGTGAAFAIDAFEFPIVVPGASVPLKIRIDLLLSAYREAIFLAICAATAAAFFPALRASHMNIVESLKRS